MTKSGVFSVSMSALLIAAMVLLVPAVARAQPAPGVAALAQAFLLDELFDIMAQEGRDYATAIRDEQLDGQAGRGWQMAVERIYDPQRMRAAFIERFDAELADNAATITDALAFATSPIGARVLRLEIDARAAMLDRDIDAAAREALEEARGRQTPQFALVAERIAVNDLVEANVSLGLNTSIAYYEGFLATAPDAFQIPQSDLLPEVWAQEREIRHESDIWLHSYFLLAYAPLAEQELRDYIAFSASPAGESLNNALFVAFESVFVDISYQLGRAVGQALSGLDL